MKYLKDGVSASCLLAIADLADVYQHAELQQIWQRYISSISARDMAALLRIERRQNMTPGEKRVWDEIRQRVCKLFFHLTKSEICGLSADVMVDICSLDALRGKEQWRLERIEAWLRANNQGKLLCATSSTFLSCADDDRVIDETLVERLFLTLRFDLIPLAALRNFNSSWHERLP